MSKKPYIPIYPGDWLKDLGDLPAVCQGFALLLLFKIWESKTPGTYKTRFSRLKNLVNMSESDSKSVLNELIEVGAFNVTFNGEEITIISRRMLREAEISQKRSEAGKKGGLAKQANVLQKSSKVLANALQIPDNDNDIDYDIDIDIDIEKDRECEGKKNEITIWPTFQDFWDSYDKKRGMPESKRKWEKLSQDKKEKIMNHVPLYVSSTIDKRYRMDPAKYLRNSGWENEIIVNQNDNEKELTKLIIENALSDKSI